VVNLGDYKRIDLQPEKAEVTEEMINAIIEQLRHQHAVLEPVERAVDFNDIITLDVESLMKEASFINQKGAQYPVLKGSKSPAPGFAEQLVGIKRGRGKNSSSSIPPISLIKR